MKRPVFLNLWQIRLPLNAKLSISHRISGLILALFLPVVLSTLALMTHCPEFFQAMLDLRTHHVLAKIVMTAVILSYAFHVLAGCRHLLMDLGWGLGLKNAQRSGLILLGLFFFIAMGIGAKLWA